MSPKENVPHDLKDDVNFSTNAPFASNNNCSTKIFIEKTIRVENKS